MDREFHARERRACLHAHEQTVSGIAMAADQAGAEGATARRHDHGAGADRPRLPVEPRIAGRACDRSIAVQQQFQRRMMIENLHPGVARIKPQRTHIFGPPQPGSEDAALAVAREGIIAFKLGQRAPGLLDDPRHPAALGQIEAARVAVLDRRFALARLGRHPPVIGAAGRRDAACADKALVHQHDLRARPCGRDRAPCRSHATADDEDIGRAFDWFGH